MRETLFVPDNVWTLRRRRRGPVLWMLVLANLMLGTVLAFQTGLPALLSERSVSGTITDLYTGKPVAEATLLLDGESQRATALGTYSWPDLQRDDELIVSAQGYAVARVAASKRSTWDVALRPTTLRGRVTDAATGSAIPRATLILDGQAAFADSNGEYLFAGVRENPELVVKAPGYLARRLEIRGTAETTVALQPFTVRGIYVTAYTAAHEELLGPVFDLLDRTELNTIVVDMKNDDGSVAYQSDLPLVKEAGAVSSTLVDIEALVARARQHGVYTIARIVVFHDSYLGRLRPEWTVKSKRTGQPWRDSSGLVWLDPFRKEVWRYNTAISREVLARGFDEVQFDYVRFPTDGNLADTQYAEDSTVESREGAIEGYLAYARSALISLPGYLSADLFGLTLWAEDDMGIGQKAEGAARWLDYISPMMYPSHFSTGMMGFPVPAEHPYEILAEGSRRALNRLAGRTARNRPWLQDFSLSTPYDPQRVRQQIDAAEAVGVSGWLLWNVSNRYSEGALQPDASPQQRGQPAGQ